MTAPDWVRLLGLGKRAGSVVVGSAGVRAGLQHDEFVLIVMASDCSARTDEKVGRLARARGIAMLTGPDAAGLGRLFGQDTVQTVGVKDRKLAEGIRAKAQA